MPLDTKIPTASGEVLHIKEAQKDQTCEVHDWIHTDFETKLVPLLRERHGKGGLNVCVDCIDRVRAERERKRNGH